MPPLLAVGGAIKIGLSKKAIKMKSKQITHNIMAYIDDSITRYQTCLVIFHISHNTQCIC